MNCVIEVDPEQILNQENFKFEKNDIRIFETTRQCPICHGHYKIGNSYWQHVRYVHAKVLYQCVICEKNYKRTTMAKHHILLSHKIAWHLCGNYFRRIKKSDLETTPQKENEKNLSNCTFFKKKTLHLIKCFNCYDCDGSFSTIQELFEHVKIHKNEIPEIIEVTNSP